MIGFALFMPEWCPTTNCASSPIFAEDRYQATANELETKFVQDGPLRVLYLSNMIAEKGCLLLRDAVQSINAQRPGAILLDYAGGFVTDGEKEAFLDSIADSDYIAYHGIVKGAAKRELLLQAHILALPTFYPYEGQPICILEGYAAGCAVLTTDHSGIFDTFTPGQNGWEVEKESKTSTERAILQCLESRNAVEQIGRYNAEIARGRFHRKTLQRRFIVYNQFYTR